MANKDTIKDVEKKIEDIDITVDDKRDVNNSAPKIEDNAASPLPGTQSTYQRVEKGTKTALLYWDGWLTAQDAKLIEDDPDYFTKSNMHNSQHKSGPKRNMNLKKNWTYTPKGEIQYISTGFCGIFNKGKKDGADDGAASTYSINKQASNSSYGTTLEKNYGNNNKYEKAGPAVGTIWDLKGNAKDRSAYADVVPSKSPSKGSNSNPEDRDFMHGRSHSSNRALNHHQDGKSGPGSAYMTVGSNFGSSGNSYSRKHGTGANAGNTGVSSGYMDVQNMNSSTYGTVNGTKHKIGYGTKYDKTTGKYIIVENDDYKGPYSANGSPYRQNWKYGENKEVIYIQTSFVGIFDRQKLLGLNGPDTGSGGGNSQYGTTSDKNHLSYGSGNQGKSTGTHWDLKSNAKDRSAYADVKVDGKHHGHDDGYYSKSSSHHNKQDHRGSHSHYGNKSSGTGSAYLDVNAGNGHGHHHRDNYKSHGNAHNPVKSSGPGSAYLEVNVNGHHHHHHQKEHNKHTNHHSKGKKNDSVYLNVSNTHKKEN